MSKDKQKEFFAKCEDEWNGMPEFVQEDLRPWHQVNVRFRNQEDFDKFKVLMEQEITPKQTTLWFPHAPFRRAPKYKYIDDES